MKVVRLKLKSRKGNHLSFKNPEKTQLYNFAISDRKGFSAVTKKTGKMKLFIKSLSSIKVNSLATIFTGKTQTSIVLSLLVVNLILSLL